MIPETEMTNLRKRSDQGKSTGKKEKKKRLRKRLLFNKRSYFFVHSIMRLFAEKNHPLVQSKSTLYSSFSLTFDEQSMFCFFCEQVYLLRFKKKKQNKDPCKKANAQLQEIQHRKVVSTFQIKSNKCLIFLCVAFFLLQINILMLDKTASVWRVASYGSWRIKNQKRKKKAAILEVAHQKKTMIAHQKERKKNSNTLILPAQKKVRKIESKEISYFEIVTSGCICFSIRSSFLYHMFLNPSFYHAFSKTMGKK